MNDITPLARKIRNMPAGPERKRLYNEFYLKSEHWKIKWFRAIQRANGICQACGVAKATQVHHLSYERLGCERRSDLIALCGNCHEYEHFCKQTVTKEEWTAKLNDERIARWMAKTGY